MIARDFSCTLHWQAELLIILITELVIKQKSIKGLANFSTGEVKIEPVALVVIDSQRENDYFFQLKNLNLSIADFTKIITNGLNR